MRPLLSRTRGHSGDYSVNGDQMKSITGQDVSEICTLEADRVVPYSGMLYLSHKGVSTKDRGLELPPFHLEEVHVEVDRPDDGSGYHVEFLIQGPVGARPFCWLELEVGERSRKVPFAGLPLPDGPIEARVVRMKGGDELSAFTSMMVTLYGTPGTLLPMAERGPHWLEPLVKALGTVPSITLTESCCGHGRAPYSVLFQCADPDDLRLLGRCLTGSGFVCELFPRAGICPLEFRLVSRTDNRVLRGEPAYGAAAKLAKSITEATTYQEKVRRVVSGELTLQEDVDKFHTMLEKTAAEVLRDVGPRHMSIDKGEGPSETVWSFYTTDKHVGSLKLADRMFCFRGSDPEAAAGFFFREVLLKMCDAALEGPGTLMTGDTIKFQRQSSVVFYQEDLRVGLFAVEAVFTQGPDNLWKPTGREMVFHGRMDPAAHQWFEEHLKPLADSYLEKKS